MLRYRKRGGEGGEVGCKSRERPLGWVVRCSKSFDV